MNELKANKGVQIVLGDAKEFADLAKRYDAAQRETNIANGKKFGVADPGAIIDAYVKAQEKWAKLSPAIGRDIDKFADAIWREVYSKVDLAKL